MPLITAGEVMLGDFLTGIDNGYVVDIEEDPLGYSYVTITFHDRNGDEGELKVAADTPLEVDNSRR